jgi:hypothetical protein
MAEEVSSFAFPPWSKALNGFSADDASGRIEALKPLSEVFREWPDWRAADLAGSAFGFRCAALPHRPLPSLPRDLHSPSRQSVHKFSAEVKGCLCDFASRDHAAI